MQNNSLCLLFKKEMLLDFDQNKKRATNSSMLGLVVIMDS